jgi:hypothetical protein
MSHFTILMADDDPDDRFLTEQACLELRNGGDLRFVEDGEELMHYLRQTRKVCRSHGLSLDRDSSSWI